MMKAAVLHTRSDARAARSHLPVSFDTSYARFGDDLLLFGKDSSVEEQYCGQYSGSELSNDAIVTKHVIHGTEFFQALPVG